MSAASKRLLLTKEQCVPPMAIRITEEEGKVLLQKARNFWLLSFVVMMKGMIKKILC